MVSQINPTVPVAGNPTTASVRANFATAQGEISALQANTTGAPFLPLAGAQMRGAINLFNDPTAPMHPVTLGYFQANGGGGGSGPGGVPEAPADGTLYGRLDGSWSHAVSTTELDAAINAAPFLKLTGGTLTGPLVLAGPPTVALHPASKGYTDSNFLGLAGGTLTGSLILAHDATQPLEAMTKQAIDAKNYVSQVGASLNVQVVENTSGSNKTPALAGNVTPYNQASDGFIFAARRLSAANANGLWFDGAFLSCYGPGGNPANNVILFAGNNAAGYAQFQFRPDGSAAFGGQLSLGNANWTPPGAAIAIATNGHASIYLEGYKRWEIGQISDGNLNFYDVDSLQFAATITSNHQFQINPIPGQPSIIVNGGWGIQFSGTPYGTGTTFSFGWNTPNAGVVNVSLDGGSVVHGLQPVSDGRMKNNIAPSTHDCLATVQRLALREYRWKDLSDLTLPLSEMKTAEMPLKRVGLVAQEVHEIFPDGAIVGDTTTDRLGVVWNIETNTMLALGFGAIQQLAVRVAALEARGS